MRYKEENIASVADLLGFLDQIPRKLVAEFSTKDEPISHVPIWYRGLTRSEYDLETSMHFKGAARYELAMMNRFKQNANQFLNHFPEEPWEWLFLMRHYGMPSRLLDWSESPLVGLFFAVTPVTRTAVEWRNFDEYDLVEGALWCLLPCELNAHSNFGEPSHNIVPMFEDKEAPFTLYTPADVVGPAAPIGAMMPVAGIGKRGSIRMQAQQGVFTIAHNDPTPVNKVKDGSHVWRYRIPGKAKALVRRQLKDLGVTALSIFPDLDNVAAAATEAFGIHV